MEPQSNIDSAVQLQRQRDGGASWFYWVAALSLINTFSAFTGSDWRFVIGLGITQLIDLFASTAEIGSGVGLLLSLLFAASFGALGYYGRSRPGLLLLGMLLFAADGVIFVLIEDWVGVGFHAFVLFFVWGGYRAARALQQQPAAAPVG